jgi:drug/metabolite transporter (DMT)-like permease
MKKIATYGPLFIILAALLWSFDGLLRTSLYALPPAVVVFYEHFLGLIVLLFFSRGFIKDVKKLTRKQWIAMIIVGVCAGALGTIFYTAALGQVNYIQFSVVVLLQQLQPIWGISIAALLLKEKLKKSFIFWAGLAFISTYFITFKDLTVNLATGQGTIIAALLALAAGIMWGSSTALSKYVLNSVSFMTATILRFAIAPLFALFVVIGLNQTPALFTLTQPQWVSLLLIVFSTGMVGLVLYYFGLKRTQAKVSSVLELIWPMSAIFIDYFYFHHTLSLTQVFGVAVLLLCMYKITKTETKPLA